MQKRSSYFWTPEQKALLKQAYTQGAGLSDAERLIPKSRTTIAAQASRLRLTDPRPRKPK